MRVNIISWHGNESTGSHPCFYTVKYKMCFYGIWVFWNVSDMIWSDHIRLQRNERLGLLEVSQGLRPGFLVTSKFRCGCLLKVPHVPLIGIVCGSLGLGLATAIPRGDFIPIIQIPISQFHLFPYLLVVRVWARFFQVLGYLFRELKMRAHTDLQKKQNKFAGAKKALTHVSRPHEWDNSVFSYEVQMENRLY